MLNKITAAAISTALCLNTAIPCISDCAQQQIEETNAGIASSAVFAETDKIASSTTSEYSAQITTAMAEISGSSVKTEIAEEPVDEEPVEEGSLGATISYRLYEDGTIYISGRGIMDNYSKSPFKSPELINKAVVSNKEGTIFTIGSNVFSNCTNMTEVNLPSSVITIESNAFANCTSLSLIQFDGADPVQNGELVLSDSIEDVKDSAFLNCKSIESVVVPETTMAIGTSAFSGCSALKKAVINGSNIKLSEYIFNRCISLEDLTLPFAGFDLDSVNEDNSRVWLGYLFGDSVSDDSGEYTYGVRSYNSYLRHIPLSLENITILDGKNIPSYAFDGFKSLKKIVVPDDIEVIGECSFRNCSGLSDFDIPSALTSIGNEAFSGCAKISVDIPESVTTIGYKAFLDCASITEINVPDSVESIGESAFSGCTSLKKIVIANEGISMGEYIFNRCISLEDLTLPFAGFDLESVNAESSRAWLGYMFGDPVSDDNGDYTYGVRSYNGYTRYIPVSLESITILGGKRIPSYAFDGFSSLKKIVVPDDIETTGEDSFRNCSGLVDFDMPSAIKSIGSEAFAGCANISVEIPEGIISIGSKAFADCKSITEINVSDSIESIGDSAFSGCTSLKKAVIKSEKTTIGEYIFNRCISLEDLTLPFAGYDPNAVDADSPRAWLGYMFGDAVSDENGDYTYGVRSYNGYTRYIPMSLENITILGGKNIPSYAFDGFSSLKNINIPAEIEFIGDSSFKNCSSLVDFELPSALTSIGNEAFASCSSMPAFDIPKGVTKIGNKAFMECTSIKYIIVPKATETIGDSAFSGCTSLKKAVIKGGSTGIGEYVFNRCISLEDLTLPFTAFSEAAANTENSRAWLGYMFGDAVSDENGDYTYGVRSYNGYTRYIPNSLKNITFLDGQYMAKNLLQGFSSVENVTLPKDIKEIGDSSFDGCENIVSVFYPDTEEAWADVNIKDKNESIDGKIVSFVKGPMGDTNEDGIVDAADASNILALYAKVSTGSEPPTDYEYSVYDVNRDGLIDSTDASVVLSYYSYASTSNKDMSFEDYMVIQSIEKNS